MSRTKFELLARHIRLFIAQVNNDLDQKKNILLKYQDESSNQILIRSEHDAWLLCEMPKEKRVKENNRRRFQQKPDLSEVLEKLNTKSLPVFFKISNKIQERNKFILEEHLHSFFPDEKSTIKMSLKRIKEVVDARKEPSQVVKAALLCRKMFIKYLFKELDKEFITVKVINCFLDEQHLALLSEKASPPEWKSIIPLKNRPGRHF